MIFVFLFLTASLYGQTYFVSDGLGIAGPPAGSLEDSKWILEIRESDDLHQRILFKDKTEYKRWDSTDLKDEKAGQVSEKYYYKSSLRTETIIGSDGRIFSETSYDSSGAFLNRKEYDYDSGGRLSGISTFDEDGTRLDENTLLYRFDNSLRGIENPDGEMTEWRAGEFDRHFLDTLYIREGSITAVYRFTENNLVFFRTSIDDSEYEEVRYEYNDDHELIREVRTNIPGNRRTEISYNPDRAVLNRYVYKDNRLESTEVNTYLGSKLVGTVQRSGGLKLRWSYEYRNDESEPWKTTLFRNDMIEKQTERRDDGVVEILYRRGVEIMRRAVEEEGD